MSDMESNCDYPTLLKYQFNTLIQYEDLPKESSTTPTDPFDTLHPLDKEQTKMAPGCSLSTDEFSFSTRVYT
jgi:hypothetical protein